MQRFTSVGHNTRYGERRHTDISTVDDSQKMVDCIRDCIPSFSNFAFDENISTAGEDKDNTHNTLDSTLETPCCSNWYDIINNPNKSQLSEKCYQIFASSSKLSDDDKSVSLCQQLHTLLSNMSIEDRKWVDSLGGCTKDTGHISLCHCTPKTHPTPTNDKEHVHGTDLVNDNDNDNASEIQHAQEFPFPHSDAENNVSKAESFVSAQNNNIENCVESTTSNTPAVCNSLNNEPNRESHEKIMSLSSCDCANNTSVPNLKTHITGASPDMDKSGDSKDVESSDETDAELSVLYLKPKKRRRSKRRPDITSQNLSTDSDTDSEETVCEYEASSHSTNDRQKQNSESSNDDTVFSSTMNGKGNFDYTSQEGSNVSLHDADSGVCSMNSESSAASLKSSSSFEDATLIQHGKVTFLIGESGSCNNDTVVDSLVFQKSASVTFTIGCDSDDEDEVVPEANSHSSCATFFIGDNDSDSETDDFPQALVAQKSRIGPKSYTAHSSDFQFQPSSRFIFNDYHHETKEDMFSPVMTKSSSSPDLSHENSLDALNFIWNIKISKTDPCKLNRNNKKKVTFAEGDSISQVFLIESSPEFDESRKGPWEGYALDRYRFELRIDETECMIAWVLDPSHRQKVFMRYCA